MQIKLTDRVVIYDKKHDIYTSPRVYWMFKVFGHTKVQVLDGGFKAWQREGKPISTKEDTYKDYFTQFNYSMFSSLSDMYEYYNID